MIKGDSSIQIPILVIRPSLRDSMLQLHDPTLERVGYSQISLRETAEELPWLHLGSHRGAASFVEMIRGRTRNST